MTGLTRTGDRNTVLILSAGMGGGHFGAAEELSRRLVLAGYEARIVDLLDMMRFGYGRFITAFYRAQLTYAPWTYQAVYSLWRNNAGFVNTANGVDTRMARRDLLDCVDRIRPTAIVSTYNLGSQVLGDLSAEGSLDVPAFSFVTDFGVHPYWVHDAIDGYLVVHESSADHIARLSTAPIAVCGPLVASEFFTEDDLEPAARPEPGSRADTRALLGLADLDTAALVVAGAWGVGDIEETVDDLARIKGCVPVVVCGTNAGLATRLRKRSDNVDHILGFTDRMAELMRATDVLVENAGGLTSFEALASGLPVITYRPIPGHGLDNADAMDEAGVTTFAHDRSELRTAVAALAGDGEDGDERARQVEAARSVFQPDPTAAIVGLVDPANRVEQGKSAEPEGSSGTSSLTSEWPRQR